MKTIGLYIHIPFCLRKCAYCNFASYPGRLADIDRYIDALIKEARLYSDVLQSRAIDTVFLGGGTPSLLTPAQVKKLLDGLRSFVNWEGTEVTIEANPETLEEDKLAAYAALGVNRLSIGLQTHEDALLRDIGRNHTWDTFEKAYINATRCFDNINADIIFGLPGQTETSFKETLELLIDLSPKHISAYALKLEAGTPLEKRYKGADEDNDRQMYHLAAEKLTKAGYVHYETSNFAKPGSECRHNLKYWMGEEYLGLGAAAYSYLNENGYRRFGNSADLDDYLNRIENDEKPIFEEDILSETDLILEYIMLRLRLRQGIDFDDYRKRFDQEFSETFKQAVETTQKAGLITLNSNGIQPTLKGFDLQNTLIVEYIKKM